MESSLLLLLFPTLAILGLRWLTGSPHEQIELNRQVRNSLERAVMNCNRIELSLGTTSSTGPGPYTGEAVQDEDSDRNRLVDDLRSLRTAVHQRHEHYGNMTVKELRVKLNEVHALERSSLKLLDTVRHRIGPTHENGPEAVALSHSLGTTNTQTLAGKPSTNATLLSISSKETSAVFPTSAQSATDQ